MGSFYSEICATARLLKGVQEARAHENLPNAARRSMMNRRIAGLKRRLRPRDPYDRTAPSTAVKSTAMTVGTRTVSRTVVVRILGLTVRIRQPYYGCCIAVNTVTACSPNWCCLEDSKCSKFSACNECGY